MRFKILRKSKPTQVDVPSSASSSSAPDSSLRRKQILDTVNLGLNFTANIAEVSDVLAPLKVACKAAQSIIEVVQVSGLNRRGLGLTNAIGDREQPRRLDRPSTAVEELPIGSGGASCLVRNLSSKRESCRRGVSPAAHPLCRVCDASSYYYRMLNDADTSKIFMAWSSIYAKNKATINLAYSRRPVE